jgi:esterase
MKLNYKAYGSGKPIIILHGLFGSVDNWHSFARRLGEYLKVFVIDQRNHGRSPHDDELSYEVMAEDLREFMAEVNLDSATLLGHSMGGKTAMQFALTYPQKVDKLFVVDTSPKKNAGRQVGVIDAIKALNMMDLERITDRKRADEQLMPYIKELTMRQFLLKNLIRSKNGAFEWRVNLNAISKNYDKILSGVCGTSFHNSSIFIRGENSNHILDEDWDEIRKYFPSAELCTIPGAGHWVHTDVPELFLKRILDFLNT